ncbi:class I SAM-dependent methyltransferase [Opitutus terrae]|uniref:Methyltransferase type 11 n=1 Tax=Opitutus terrae (strain DSM 11246 / JCM 15787 / PB90-1) TaxID=452637 RepID=B1ZWZ7_OPITP|nr:class I SAM-dependent methyltransferase [Opitutus terrae]ACB75108.1 Methyltransferase type 11 [Opitutus terrae PB90-1]
MTPKPDCYWPIFLEVFEALPRQGPGSRECAARALALGPALPAEPRIADLGCGSGGQTLQLAELLPHSTIDALDSHAPLLERLKAGALAKSLQHRIRVHRGDMDAPPFADQSFDLIWSEGAVYNLGVTHALRRWRPLLRPGGWIAFTEAVWLRGDPPPAARAFWEAEYPRMADVPANLAIITEAGFETLGHFPLPAEAWWSDFYRPLEARVGVLKKEYAGDPAAQTALSLIQHEVDIHRRYGEYYSYAFFVVRPR